MFENEAADPNLTGRGDAIADAFSFPFQTITLKNSIVASPTRGLGDDCYAPAGVILSLGHTIASDASCALSGSGDRNDLDPLLGPLTDNGGPTQTHAPIPGSPALDAVLLSSCTDADGAQIIADQRGVARPQNGTCDVGSVEVVQRLYSVCLVYDSGKAVRSGATIPIKLQLCDGTGANLSSSGITLHATGITRISSLVDGPVHDAGNANPDNDFRFDASLGGSGGYIFNLSTTSLTTGTYRLHFEVSGESLSYTAQFQVK